MRYDVSVPHCRFMLVPLYLKAGEGNWGKLNSLGDESGMVRANLLGQTKSLDSILAGVAT